MLTSLLILCVVTTIAGQSTSEGSVRIVGGALVQQGRVEIYYGGQWGTICDNSWDDNAASVICRQLGFGNIGSAFQGAQFGQGSGEIWFVNARCNGNEDNIASCTVSRWEADTCGDHVAGVHCGSIRLLDGDGLNEGRVEVYHDDQWGTVCDDGWDDTDASVACLQLGFTADGTAFGSARYGEGSGQIWLDDISCEGSETSIDNCEHGGWGQHNCAHGEDAGVRCKMVRLVGGTVPQEGRVEVLYDGQWGTICDDSWDENDASVICRQLGYGNIGSAFQSARFGQGTDQIWLDDVSCTGNETDIVSCQTSGWGVHNCGHHEDAGVYCGAVRLLDGTKFNEGRVEVYHDGQWGTICDDSWDDTDASVVCRQLGYGTIGTAVGSAQYGEGSGQIWLDNVSCNGSEANIENCKHDGWGEHNCGHGEDAGVQCEWVRLVGGVRDQEGRVEINHDGQWGTICDDSWDDNDASVICRQLGYGNVGTAFHSARFGQGDGQIWLDNVDCTGDEYHINNCQTPGWGVHNCVHNEDAGVHCGTIRLTAGGGLNEGRVEVYHDGEWGTVCDDSWDDSDASVVCIQLGYSPSGRAFGSAHYGEGSGQIWLDDISCDGSETNIEDCEHAGWGQNNCGHGEDAGVKCERVRLVDGLRDQEGRLEVYHDGQWGTVCDDSFHSDDASVICRQLGYGDIGTAYYSIKFGEGSGQIWLDDVHCTGDEDSIDHCQHNGWGIHNCDHSEDVGVHCGNLRLLRGATLGQGRVEIYHDGEWGTVCDDAWDNTDADVVCRQLGYSDIGKAFGSAAYHEGSGPIWLSDISCSGSETSIEDCGHGGWGQHNCEHGQDAGVRCLRVRLVDGLRPQEGRLEIYYDGQWGTICDDSFDINEASVICRQLGYGDIGTVFPSTKYGAGSGQIWLDDVHCTGDEDSIDECPHNGVGVHNCGHGEDVGVRCGTIRLARGASLEQGRVEIYHDGEWGTVCDDSWDDSDASVVCRQLGYSESGKAFGSATYHEGSGQIWLDDVSCDGDESSIEDCGHGGWGQHNCGHGEDAGVRCQNVRLVSGIHEREGRVEIYRYGRWGTICDDSFDDNDASVICRQLGFGEIGTAFYSIKYGEGSGQIWLDELQCTGNEDSIDLCQHGGWGVHNCGHNEDAGVQCGTIRLLRGATLEQGRVEIYHDGEWGTVCDDAWDNTDADVVCRQLGYSESGVAFGSAAYHEGSGPIWLDDVSCSGSESSIEDCGHGGWGQHNCGHGEDAGVRCLRVRLVDGLRVQEGRVEIYRDGQWGTICDDYFDSTEASVICRQLGFGEIGTAFYTSKYGEGSGQIWLDDLHCNGDENSIDRCQHGGWGVHNCGHSEDIGVHCGTIRLLSGATLQQGRVEIYHDGEWGTVCDDSWDDSDASVVCRQLGYSDSGKAFGNAAYFEGSGQIWLDDLSCNGYESNVDDCGHRGWGQHNCGHSEDAGALCRTVRLAGGGGSNEGRIEVYHYNQWGTICDDYWDNTDASVVCRQMGYDSGTAVSRAYFGEGSGPIWLDDVGCSGSEKSIESCDSNDWGSHNCGHGEDAGVRCSVS